MEYCAYRNHDGKKKNVRTYVGRAFSVPDCVTNFMAVVDEVVGRFDMEFDAKERRQLIREYERAKEAATADMPIPTLDSLDKKIPQFSPRELIFVARYIHPADWISIHPTKRNLLLRWWKDGDKEALRLLKSRKFSPEKYVPGKPKTLFSKQPRKRNEDTTV